KDGKRDGWFSYKQHLKGDVRNVWVCTSYKTAPKPTPTPTPSRKGTYTGVIPTPTLKSGSKGDKVKNLQKFLNWYGKYGLTVDGKFGAKTTSALKAFQKAEKITADGIYGKNSQAKAKVYKKVSP
ncbi:MAG: peptidoglycan-binding protein, partial [Bacteroidaceae bacterium]|nr:peptidoglycan-binding protein [Bacteroidaceae bacterium]